MAHTLETALSTFMDWRLERITLNFKSEELLRRFEFESSLIAKLRIVEVERDQPTQLPDNIIPVKLEPVVERAGGVIPVPSSDRFVLYYLER